MTARRKHTTGSPMETIAAYSRAVRQGNFIQRHTLGVIFHDAK